jgi:hypothetical protein
LTDEPEDLAGTLVDKSADSSNGSVEYEEEDEEESDNEYSMRSETLPDAPVYDKTLQILLRETKTNIQSLERTIRSCPLSQNNGSTLASLADQTGRLANFEFPKTRIVGFVGDSGTGMTLGGDSYTLRAPNILKEKVV